MQSSRKGGSEKINRRRGMRKEWDYRKKQTKKVGGKEGPGKTGKNIGIPLVNGPGKKEMSKAGERKNVQRRDVPAK